MPLQGFTLIEMLVVLAIAALLAGMTMLTMAGMAKRNAREGAAENARSVLNQARVSAVDGGRGALVRVDPKTRTIFGLASTPQAAWHFDELKGAAGSQTTPGARSSSGTVVDGPSPGSPSMEQGKAGLCLSLNGTDEYVNCGRQPVYDQTDGIRIEAWVRPSSDASTDDVLPIIVKANNNLTSFNKGYALWLECTDGTGAGKFLLHGRVATTGGDIALQPPPSVVIPGGRWTHVALEFDGYEARLLLDGLVVDLDSYANDPSDTDPNPATNVTFPPPARLKPARGNDLLIGRAGSDYFEGRIDEPMLLSVAGGTRVTLPENVAVAVSSGIIHFDGMGQLDVLYHQDGRVYVCLGDPYQAAELAADINASAVTLSVRPRNPFPQDGGVILVGREGEYEAMSYTAASGNTVTGLTRGDFVTGAVAHYAGERVLYARVLAVNVSGLISRED